MALGSGWSTKALLTIDSSLVSADVTDLPILITFANLPSGITGTSGCNSDGGDIRFTEDVDGLIEYARDIIKIDKASDIVTCYVKIPSISSSTDTTFYVWYNNPNATEPSETSDSGSKTCWSDYYGVYHFNNMTDAWKGIKDTSGSWTNYTTIGVSDASTGHADGLTSAEISTTFGMTVPETFSFNEGDKDFMFWCNFNGSLNAGNWCTGFNGIPFGWLASGQFGAGWGNVSSSANAVSATGWHFVLLQVKSDAGKVYVNGVDKTQQTTVTQSMVFDAIGEGASTSPTHSLSELRSTRLSTNSLDYYDVMYTCESDPASFVSAGTPIVVASSMTITINVVDENVNVIGSANVYIDEDNILPYVLNGVTDENGVVSTTYSGVNIDATLRVRKYGYKAFKTPISLIGNDINQTVSLITDSQQV